MSSSFVINKALKKKVLMKQLFTLVQYAKGKFTPLQTGIKAICTVLCTELWML